MKITDIGQRIHLNPYAQPPDKSAAQEASQASNGGQAVSSSGDMVPSGDKVELSAQSKELKKVYDILAETPEVRRDRIDELKKLIDEGRYEVDPEAVADKMVNQFLLDLNK